MTSMTSASATNRQVRTDPRPRAYVALLYVAFFLSGFSALIYQTAWQRMLGLFAGSDMVAITIVVGAFLFGLGVGSLWSASFADRLSHRRALVVFALCELGISAFALTSRVLFYDLVFGRLVTLAQSQMLVTFVVFAGLLLPTILMGMSLPLLSKALVYRIDTASSEIGWLYGVNTFGAGCGALFAGFYIIGTFGYEVTVYFAALLNFLVFVGALLVASSFPHGRADQASAAARSPPLRRIPGRIWLWSAIVFISGFLIISLEIVWFRVLGILMQSNAYAFPLILSCFLVGDAAGIIYGARAVRRISNPLHFFQWLQGVVALYAVGSLGMLYLAVSGFDLSPWLTDGKLVESAGLMRLAYLSILAALAGICILPPAFLLGMSFPITQKAVQDDPDLVGQRVGQIQLFNIFGNTCGAIITGLVLLNGIGTSGTIRLVGLVGLIFLVALSFQLLQMRERVLRHCAIPGALLALAVLAFPANAAFWSRLHGSKLPAGTIVGEDRTGVVVMRHVAKSKLEYGDAIETGADLLYVSGYAQSRVPFLTIHGALGMIGALVHPNPRSMLLIGHGSGSTPYAAGVNPRSEHIRVVELVQPVYSVMERFSAASPNAAVKALLADQRFERRVADGRHFLYTDQASYDVIQSDAIYPSSSHAGLLYSVEFFRQVKKRLSDNGIFVQWMPTDRTAATFLEVFPYVLQLNDVLLGSNQPIPYSRELLEAKLKDVELRKYLAAGQWNPESIFNRLTEKPERTWGPDDARTDRDVNTDLFPKDEYFLNRRKRSVFGSGKPPSPVPAQ
jgi:spermidine synthase